MRPIDSSYDRHATQAAIAAQRAIAAMEDGTVRDVMPYEGAVAYVTDSLRCGIQYEDGHVDWLGDDPVSAFGEGAEVMDE